MIRRIIEPQLPPAPGTDKAVIPSFRELIRWLRRFSADVIGQLNSQVQGVGDVLDSGGTNVTLKPTHAIHHVGDTGSIQYIQPPTEQYGVESDETTVRNVSSFTGPLFLIPDGAWTLVDTGTGVGRILKNSTAVEGQVMVLVFDGEAWAPSY